MNTSSNPSWQAAFGLLALRLFAAYEFLESGLEKWNGENWFADINKPKAACQEGLDEVFIYFPYRCVSNGMGRNINRHHPIFHACLDAAALKN